MEKINKENIEKVMNRYRNFHDCNFINITYDIYEKTIYVMMQLYWKLSENMEYERTKKTLKLVFCNVNECGIKENESCDFIKEVIMKYIEIEDLGERLYFASDENDPIFYVVCEMIQMEEKEEVKKNNIKN